MVRGKLLPGECKRITDISNRHLDSLHHSLVLEETLSVEEECVLSIVWLCAVKLAFPEANAQ